MRLRRRKSKLLSNAPRQRRTPEPEQAAPPFAYRARRSDDELNIGRMTRRAALQAAPKHLRRLVFQRFGLVILLLAIGFSLANTLSLSTDAKVLLLSSETDTFLQDKKVYQAATDKLLAGSILNRNKITINTAQLNEKLMKQFPELATVSTTIPLLSKRPLVYIQPADPALILTTRSGTFVIDNRGKALLLASNLPQEMRQKLPSATDQSGLSPKLNQQAISSNAVTFIRTVIAQLTAKQFSVSNMVLPNASSQLDVYLQGQPYIIKFNLQNGDPRRQVGTFIATQSKLQAQNTVPSKYIDVRVSGRAYYQ